MLYAALGTWSLISIILSVGITTAAPKRSSDMTTPGSARVRALLSTVFKVGCAVLYCIVIVLYCIVLDWIELDWVAL